MVPRGLSIQKFSSLSVEWFQEFSQFKDSKVFQLNSPKRSLSSKILKSLSAEWFQEVSQFKDSKESFS